MRTTWLLSFALSLTACTGSSGPAEPSSSGTLAVTATVAATNGNYLNESDPSLFSAGLTVDIFRADQQRVTDAEVTITGGGDTIQLEYDTRSGSYTAWVEGYDRQYTLDVAAGDDFLSGFTVTGPDIHVFTSPVQNEQVPAGTPLTVEWSRDVEASAVIGKWGTDGEAIPDTGAHTFPADLVRVQSSDYVTLRRSIEDITADGLASFTVRVSNVVTFAVDGQ